MSACPFCRQVSGTCLVCGGAPLPEPGPTDCRFACQTAAFEAGRLAAIRAEVAYFVWLVGTMPTEMGAEPFSKRRRRELAKLRAQAADCRRWLEATR